LNDQTAVPYLAPPEGEFASVMATDRVRIAHSPSNRAKKGTAVILPVLDRLRGEADIDLIENVPYAECARRRGQAQVFVDQMEVSIGAFGAAATEAMAAGCVALADVRNLVSEWDKFLPRAPVIDVRTPADLERALRGLLADRDRLQELRQKSLDWARENFSPEPLARYWLRHLS
jgi:glycosyltransferase involved in cell wall biosynthesis